ncbi:MAG: UDP-N-acetylmuramoyl-L-alanyl-D-glutamate--2,6-diaminopimelate ligase [Helicobacteraceae bacterium]|nr:UDP-N-acetylmuramoyl-L-alanyl-D-glutamate--2,6-diaminopimelate ligase [Helicobacteraceae bacterium]
MKIELKNDFQSKFLTDNTKETLQNPKDSIFVKTALNCKYINELENKNIKMISPLELGKFLELKPKIIGITGTNGKTTIASCIYSLLLSLGFKAAMLGTRGFFVNDKQISPKGLTTPTLLELYKNIDIVSKEQCKYFIMEVSSHAIAQNRIEGLNFALKILSNITSDHLDFHNTRDEYIRVKNSFFSDDSLKLINKECKEAAFNLQNAYTYAIELGANFKINAYSLKDGINAHISFNDFRNKINEETTLQSCLAGKHNLYNILASIGAVKLLESSISLQDISDKLEEFGGVEGRMQVVNNNPLVIVDFAHTPDGMKNIFEAFLGRKLKVLFGAGGDRDRLKRPIMGSISERYATKIYLTSDNPRSENPASIIDEILGGITNKAKVEVESNRKIAISNALKELKSDEILLILGKGDETYQIIGTQLLPFDDRLEVKEFYKN